MPDPTPPRQILVACYSLSGHTRRLALELSRACNADVEMIGDMAERSGWIGQLRSAVQAFFHLQPAIRPSRSNPRDYALVVVCTPVWAWNMASPMRSWLLRHRADIRRVACVCTCRRSGHEKVLADLALLCGRPALAKMALTTDRIEQKTHRRRVQGFASRLCDAVQMPRPSQQDAA